MERSAIIQPYTSIHRSSICYFSYARKKSNQKKAPCPASLCASVPGAARVGTRSAQTGRHAFSAPLSPMLDAGQRRGKTTPQKLHTALPQPNCNYKPFRQFWDIVLKFPISIYLFCIYRKDGSVNSSIDGLRSPRCTWRTSE